MWDMPRKLPLMPASHQANRDKTIRRRIRTPFTLAERRAMRTFASVGTVAYGEGVLFITTPSEGQLHCTHSAPDRPTTSRWSPDEAPTADSGSGTHSNWPSRQHRGVGSANVKRA